MPRLLPLILLCGCVSVHNPQATDTQFDENKRDWVEIYTNEIKIAVENDDAEAYHFFMRELLVEKTRIWKEKQNGLNKGESSE